jgi:hypothetical protein
MSHSKSRWNGYVYYIGSGDYLNDLRWDSSQGVFPTDPEYLPLADEVAQSGTSFFGSGLPHPLSKKTNLRARALNPHCKTVITTTSSGRIEHPRILLFDNRPGQTRTVLRGDSFGNGSDVDIGDLRLVPRVWPIRLLTPNGWCEQAPPLY